MKITMNFRLGFTLIEMSIVLVIIGLIVGGVLVGQSLIAAATMRAQITQIEKFNTAANTFYGKYGYLPGDICANAVTQFGFVTRAGGRGRGDCNGIIEGFNYVDSDYYGWTQNGETVFFWEDLSTAQLIEGGFNTAKDAGTIDLTPTTTPSISAFLPAAKLGGGNQLYIYSLGNYYIGSPGANYFCLAVPSNIASEQGGITAAPGLTVAQAYGIDIKTDDGLPQAGRVTANYISGAATAPPLIASPNAGTDSATTCYNSTTGGYSISKNNGAGVNCALSFRFQ
jgi:prepilin-type N-terminal cleavage/methylation domain-containing protein